MDDDIPEKSSGLGSLAQVARSKNLNSARWILIVIGLLNGAGYGFLFIDVGNQVDRLIEEERKKLPPGMVLDPAKVQEEKTQLIRLNQMYFGGFMAVGLVLFGLGLVVYRIPVVATVLGLILYIGGNIVGFALSGIPENLCWGIFVKILIIAGLFKAVQAAIAYQREQQAGMA